MKEDHLQPAQVLAGPKGVTSALELVRMLEQRYPEPVYKPTLSDQELRFLQGARTVIATARQLVYGDK